MLSWNLCLFITNSNLSFNFYWALMALGLESFWKKKLIYLSLMIDGIAGSALKLGFYKNWVKGI